jgi:hypothetical protein
LPATVVCSLPVAANRAGSPSATTPLPARAVRVRPAEFTEIAGGTPSAALWLMATFRKLVVVTPGASGPCVHWAPAVVGPQLQPPGAAAAIGASKPSVPEPR